jgi:osmotically inducible protein OsmC
MERTASAEWVGGLRDGNGKISSKSGALSNIPYSFKMRFENEPGTNPEELLASAHAGCFTMALSAILESMGLKPRSLHTKATLNIEKTGEDWTITTVNLNTSGQVPGATAEQFIKAAEQAKSNCPVSRLFRANITLEASLQQEKAA